MKWMYVVVVAVVFWGTSLSAAWSQDSVFGLRGGISDKRNSEDFQQVDVFASRRLPWQWGAPQQWRGGVRLIGALGLLQGEGSKVAWLASVGPALTLTSPGESWLFQAGISPTLITRHAFDQEDFGGAMQFISHVAARWQPGARWLIGYRLQHMSNARIYHPNPGLNLHMIEIGWRF